MSKITITLYKAGWCRHCRDFEPFWKQLKKLLNDDKELEEIVTVNEYVHEIECADFLNKKIGIENIIDELKNKFVALVKDKEQQKKYTDRYNELKKEYETIEDMNERQKAMEKKTLSIFEKKGINGFPTILVEIKDGKSFYYEGNRESITDLVKGIFEDKSIKIGNQSVKAYLEEKLSSESKNGMTGGFFDYSKHKKLKYHREYMKCRNLYLKLKNK